MTLYVPVADWAELKARAQEQAENCIYGAEMAEQIEPNEIVEMEMKIRFTLRADDSPKGVPIA
jgi:hypothetical protein